MGASITVGLGMRHVLPPEQARRVVSVIGDSTFVHSGLTGLAEMIYNPPKSGHVVILLDNGTTAMTGHQEHAGTGRDLKHNPTGRLTYEALAAAMGIRNVHVAELGKGSGEFEKLVQQCLDSGELAFIVARRPCILVAADIRQYEKAAAEKCAAAQENP
jgi:indolepyruvate ferredoxin oxidoreductase alpha subunit